MSSIGGWIVNAQSVTLPHAAPVPRHADDDNYKEDGEGASSAADAKGGKKMDSKTKAKAAKAKSAVEDVLESADSSGALQKLDEGTLKFAVCTGVLASRLDSKDVKVQSFSISLFGKVLFEDQKLGACTAH